MVTCACCRQMFSDIRLFIDELSASARCPAFIRTILQKAVSIVSNFAPPIVTVQWHSPPVTSTLSVRRVNCSLSTSIHDLRWRYFQFRYSMPKGMCVFILVMLAICKMYLHARLEVILSLSFWTTFTSTVMCEWVRWLCHCSPVTHGGTLELVCCSCEPSIPQLWPFSSQNDKLHATHSITYFNEHWSMLFAFSFSSSVRNNSSSCVYLMWFCVQRL